MTKEEKYDEIVKIIVDWLDWEAEEPKAILDKIILVVKERN